MTVLVDIQPRELKFVFESKKQSSCAIQLTSNSDQYIAFKVKTTSPKKYCVRPNIGIIKPKETCDFTVIMQAQRIAPPDLLCKDKFLVQSTEVPFGTTEDDITSEMFAKDSGKYIEDKKIRVILVSPPPNLPVLLPVNGVTKQDLSYEMSMHKENDLGGLENIPPLDPGLKEEGFKFAWDTNGYKSLKSIEPKPNKDEEEHKSTNIVVESKLGIDVEESKLGIDVEESNLANKVEDLKLSNNVKDLKLIKDVEDLKLSKEDENLKLSKENEDLKLKLSSMKSKINEAELRITKLAQEKEMMKQEMEILRRKGGVRQVHVGFPFLFVVMISLISVVLGYYMHR